MNPISFPESNFTFTKPNDMTDDQCGSLPVFKGVDTTGVPCIVSCWQLTEEDKKRILETGVVWLNICGTGMPPVSVFAKNPFE